MTFVLHPPAHLVVGNCVSASETRRGSSRPWLARAPAASAAPSAAIADPRHLAKGATTRPPGRASTRGWYRGNLGARPPRGTARASARADASWAGSRTRSVEVIPTVRSGRPWTSSWAQPRSPSGWASSATGVVHVWRDRYADFPKPVAELRRGPIWAWPDVGDVGSEDGPAQVRHRGSSTKTPAGATHHVGRAVEIGPPEHRHPVFNDIATADGAGYDAPKVASAVREHHADRLDGVGRVALGLPDHGIDHVVDGAQRNPGRSQMHRRFPPDTAPSWPSGRIGSVVSLSALEREGPKDLVP